MIGVAGPIRNRCLPQWVSRSHQPGGRSPNPCTPPQHPNPAANCYMAQAGAKLLLAERASRFLVERECVSAYPGDAAWRCYRLGTRRHLLGFRLIGAQMIAEGKSFWIVRPGTKVARTASDGVGWRAKTRRS